MYYFIVNGNSRSGRGKKIWQRVEAELKRQGIVYEAYLTTASREAKYFARELSRRETQEEKILVVLGGDGTMNEVLDGLQCEAKMTLGYIPAGSGNDLARSLKLPRNPKKALRHILLPKKSRMLDYGVVSYGSDEVAHRRFCVSSGIGFDAAVCHELLHAEFRKNLAKIHMEKLAYVLVGVKQFVLAKPTKGYFLLDGTRRVDFQHLYFASFHIHPFEGGGFRFAPNADCTDGLLEIAVCAGESKKKLIRALIHAYLGNHKKGKQLKTFRCREVSVHTERPLPVHVDGESCYSQTDLQICCIEKKIRMLV